MGSRTGEAKKTGVKLFEHYYGLTENKHRKSAKLMAMAHVNGMISLTYNSYEKRHLKNVIKEISLL